MKGSVIKIVGLCIVMTVAAAFLATLVLGWTHDMNAVKEERGPRYVVSTGSVTSMGGTGILDDNGQEFLATELEEEHQKVGLPVIYAGQVNEEGSIDIDYIEPVYFDYSNNDRLHIKAPQIAGGATLQG